MQVGDSIQLVVSLQLPPNSEHALKTFVLAMSVEVHHVHAREVVEHRVVSVCGKYYHTCVGIRLAQ